MEKDIEEKWGSAGKITGEALAFGEKLITPDSKVFEIAEAVEKKITELGGEIAFPVNISINEIAAHYSPILNDKLALKEGDYVKLDIGAHIDGYIGDAATTIRVGGKDDGLITCSKKMLEAALEAFIPGEKLENIGGVIEGVANEFGFKPIRNLTGHLIKQYVLHAGAFVPNVKTPNNKKIEEGEVYAIEPFCTNGSGWIKEVAPFTIFRWVADKPSRLQESRKILDLGKNSFKRLPFAKRWIQRIIPETKLEMALRGLVDSRALHPYGVLKEAGNGMVAQAEHTVIVKEKPLVITSWKD